MTDMSQRGGAIRELARFVVVGIVNTAFGYAIFWLGLHLMGMSPQMSNTFGYAVSLCFSFVLTRYFVFRAGDAPGGAAAWRFAIAFALAFGLNQAVLWLLLALSWRAEIAQLGAMVSYTLLFFILNKFFVFRRASPTT